MLDIKGLTNNALGFRTIHTCELCGFEPSSKNKYREKQDHLVRKHFREQIEEEIDRKMLPQLSMKQLYNRNYNPYTENIKNVFCLQAPVHILT